MVLSWTMGIQRAEKYHVFSVTENISNNYLLQMSYSTFVLLNDPPLHSLQEF